LRHSVILRVMNLAVVSTSGVDGVVIDVMNTSWHCGPVDELVLYSTQLALNHNGTCQLFHSIPNF